MSQVNASSTVPARRSSFPVFGLTTLLNFEAKWDDFLNWRSTLRRSWDIYRGSTTYGKLMRYCEARKWSDLARLSSRSLPHTPESFHLRPEGSGLICMLRYRFFVLLGCWWFGPFRRSDLNVVRVTLVVDEFVHFVMWEGDEGDAFIGLGGEVSLLAQLRWVLLLHPKTLFTYYLRPIYAFS
jgi:hypothetical protein